MSFQMSTALAHIALTVTSAWAIYQAKNYTYACIGFSLYLVNGILGTVTYGMVESSLRVYRFYSQVLLWSLCFGLPLFVSQLYVNAGFAQSLALVHFVLPLGYVFSGSHLKRGNAFILETLQIIYLAFLLYISLINGLYYGLSTVVSFTIAFYGFGTTGTIMNNTPSKDLFNYSLSFSIYFLIRTLQGN